MSLTDLVMSVPSKDLPSLDDAYEEAIECANSYGHDGSVSETEGYIIRLSQEVFKLQKENHELKTKDK